MYQVIRTAPLGTPARNLEMPLPGLKATRSLLLSMPVSLIDWISDTLFQGYISMPVWASLFLS